MLGRKVDVELRAFGRVEVRAQPIDVGGDPVVLGWRPGGVGSPRVEEAEPLVAFSSPVSRDLTPTDDLRIVPVDLFGDLGHQARSTCEGLLVGGRTVIAP